MTALLSSVSILAMELPWMPGAEREVVVPEGLSVAEMLALAFPGASEEIVARMRVVISRDGRHALVKRAGWARTFPHAGTRVVVQLVAGKGLRSILQVIVTIAAIAVANFLAPGIAAALGVGEAFVKGALTLGLTALGGILLNALFGPEKKDEDRAVLAATGWRNAFSPDRPIPVLFGELRVAPPHAAPSYVEIVAERVHLRAAFDWGYGPLEIDPLKIGDTPAADFPEFTAQTVLGLPGDPPMRHYPRQMVPEEVGVDLERPWQRAEDGEVLDDLPPISTPVSRRSAHDAVRLINILAFPAGLGFINDKGRKAHWEIVLKRRMRLVGDEDWTDLPDLTIRAKKFAGFFRRDVIDLPQRGRWEFEYERMTYSEPPEDIPESIFLTCMWQTMQSFRPEYPILMNRALALTSALARSTTKMRGTLDSLNAVGRRVARDWDPATGAWVWRATRNPSAAAIYAITGPATARPAPDDTIDWPKFQEWAEFCPPLGLHYDAFHDQDGEALEDVLRAIGAAGRAVVYHDGYRWTVYIDRPSDLIADQINARTASRLSVTASYFRPVDAYRVRFRDRTSDYEPRVRLVPWPPDVRFSTVADMEADLDHRAGTRAETFEDPAPQSNAYWRKVGPVGEGSWELWAAEIVEDLDMPGMTDPDVLWREARRRQYEGLHRSTVWSATVAGILTAPRIGSQVLASRDFISRTAASARVKAVVGDLVEIDEGFVMESGVDYAIRFRVGETDDDLGRSIVRTVMTVPGERRALTLTGGSDTGDAALKPVPGQVIQFGPAGRDATLLVVTEVTRTEDMGSVLTMVPAAPIIDELTAAEVPPPWTGRVGEIVDVGGVPPAAPVVTGVATGMAGTGEPGGLIVFLEVAADETVDVGWFDLRHKLAGAGAWAATETVTVAEGAVRVPGYDAGDQVTIQAVAVAADATESEPGPEITVTIGSGDAETPGLPSIGAGGNLGHAWIDILVPAGDSAIAVQIFANAAGDLDVETDLVRTVNITPGVPLAVADGDTTRESVVVDGGFDNAGAWTIDGDVTVSGSKAAKVASAGTRNIKQAIAALEGTDGVVWRWGMRIDATNDTLNMYARLYGGTLVSSDNLLGAGLKHGALTANASTVEFGVVASNSRTYTIDDLVLYRQTPTCLPQGTRRYWVRGINEDGAPGPAAGPVIVTII